MLTADLRSSQIWHCHLGEKLLDLVLGESDFSQGGSLLAGGVTVILMVGHDILLAS